MCDGWAESDYKVFLEKSSGSMRWWGHNVLELPEMERGQHLMIDSIVNVEED